GGTGPVLEVVLPPVPGTDDVDLIVREPLPNRRLVGGEDLLQLAEHLSLAHRSALMQAAILVGAQLALDAEHADLGIPGLNQLAASFGDVAELADEILHPVPPRPPAGAAPGIVTDLFCTAQPRA